MCSDHDTFLIVIIFYSSGPGLESQITEQCHRGPTPAFPSPTKATSNVHISPSLPPSTPSPARAPTIPSIRPPSPLPSPPPSPPAPPHGPSRFQLNLLVKNSSIGLILCLDIQHNL